MPKNTVVAEFKKLALALGQRYFATSQRTVPDEVVSELAQSLADTNGNGGMDALSTMVAVKPKTGVRFLSDLANSGFVARNLVEHTLAEENMIPLLVKTAGAAKVAEVVLKLSPDAQEKFTPKVSAAARRFPGKKAAASK
jgi:hypothetical protein